MKKIILGLRSLLKKAIRPISESQIPATKPLNRVEQWRGKGAKIGQNVRLIGCLDAVNPELIKIGDFCVIGASSAILTHCPIRKAAATTIGDYCWIGYGALILPGVNLGSEVIVGAGSVVTKSFGDRVIIAGNPAREIRAVSDLEACYLKERLENNLPIGKFE